MTMDFTIKPSEALRRGREKYPENATGYLFERRGDAVAACALGAMWVGYGGEPIFIDDNYRAYEGIYSTLNDNGVPTVEVFSKNDDGLSTEDIAAYLDSLA